MIRRWMIFLLLLVVAPVLAPSSAEAQVDESTARKEARRKKAARARAARQKAARRKAARRKAAREKAARDKAARDKAARDKDATEATDEATTSPEEEFVDEEEEGGEPDEAEAGAEVPAAPDAPAAETTAPTTAPAAPAVPAAPSAPAAEAPPAPTGLPIHGDRHYEPVRASDAPRIDGVLDDQVWKQAPEDDRFLSEFSDPFGQPTKERTVVQLAYDEQYLYVAARCYFSKPWPSIDWGLVPFETSFSEALIIYIDPWHDHSNALVFRITPGGYRGDWEVSGDGDAALFEWRGEWDAAGSANEDFWIAEGRIPWGTLRLPSDDGPFDIGINFRRQVPTNGEFAMWAPDPRLANPNYIRPRVSVFGHLAGLRSVRPDQRLVIIPYAVAGLRSEDAVPTIYRDFTGQDRRIRGQPIAAYGGLYLRMRPIPRLQVDATLNPDFSQVTPDAAAANLDRFELFFPETRQFFIEDVPRLNFGTDDFLLFYTRRLGLRPRQDAPAQFEEVPLVYGAKAVLRLPNADISALNVGIPDPREYRRDTDINFDPTGRYSPQGQQSITVVRAKKYFGSGSELGAIGINRSEAGLSPVAYRAGGIDGRWTFFDQHLIASGFMASSGSELSDETRQEIPRPSRPDPYGFAGRFGLDFVSQGLSASASYLAVGRWFDPQLGYYEETGIQQFGAQSAYVAPVQTDYVYSATFSAGIKRRVGYDGVLTTDHRVLGALGTLSNLSSIGVEYTTTDAVVSGELELAGGRIFVPEGLYDNSAISFFYESPPRRTYALGLRYTEGPLFGGYHRIAGPTASLNLSRLIVLVQAQGFHIVAGEGATSRIPETCDDEIGGGDDNPFGTPVPPYCRWQIYGARVSGRIVVGLSPDVQTTASVEMNTLDPRAATQVLTAWRFAPFSEVAAVLSRSANAPEEWSTKGEVTGIVKLSVGWSPL